MNCNLCKSILSNMYVFSRKNSQIILCDDCAGKCLTFLLADDIVGPELHNKLLSFIQNENNKKTI